MAPDWKKLATARLKELRRRDAREEILRLHAQQELQRALAMHLHARCISRAGEIADEISVAVVEMVLGEL